MKKISIFLTIACLAVCLGGSAFAQSYAITNATIVPVTSSPIQNGTVVIEGNKIAAVGSAVSIPPGAERIDASGKFVYPGMIDINTTIGLGDVSGIWQTTDNVEAGTFMSYLKASQAVNYNNRQLAIQRFTGVTTVISSPSGGIISGQEVMINLDGWSLEEITIKDPIGMKMTFPTAATRRSRYGPPSAESPSADMKKKAETQLEELKALIEKTRQYIAAMEDFEAKKRQTPPPADMSLIGLIPVVKGEIPFTIAVNGVEDIRKAIKFVKEENLKAVFVGVNDAFKIADEIADANIPVVYTQLLNLPGVEVPYDLYYSIPAVLYRAGVKFAIGVSSHSSVRTMPFMAGMAAAYGLPKEEALKSVTLYPAQMYMVDDILGSVDAGKLANLVITDGNLLEPRTHVTDMFINGLRVDLTAGEDYQMYEKYRKRPVKK